MYFSGHVYCLETLYTRKAIFISRCNDNRRGVAMKNAIFTLFVFFLGSSQIFADIINPSFEPEKYFYDTNTQYTWIDMSYFGGKSYDYVENLLATDPGYSGFEIASLPQIQNLLSSYLGQKSTFSYLYDVVGGVTSSQGTRYIGGLFDIELNSDRSNLAWLYDYMGLVLEYKTYENPYILQNRAYGGFGVWVVNTSDMNNAPTSLTPEPSTMLLIGAGLGGLAAAIGRKKRGFAKNFSVPQSFVTRESKSS